MERVKTGYLYWYITIYGEVECDYECDSVGDFKCFSSGNYFHTKEEAEAMAKKLCAVLKGADVIEMPSEEEFYKVAPSTDKLGGWSLENSRQVRGFQDCWDWLKSKIIK